MTKIEKRTTPPSFLLPEVDSDAFNQTFECWIGMNEEECRGVMGAVPLAAITNSWYIWFWLPQKPNFRELKLLKQVWFEEVIVDKGEITASVNSNEEWGVRWMSWLGMSYGFTSHGQDWYIMKREI